MPRHWEDREQIKSSLGKMGKHAHFWWFLGAVFAVLGIIGDAANITLGLESTSWLLLAVVAFLASITEFLGWAVAWYLQTKEATKQ